jgi:hypothetical protein
MSDWKRSTREVLIENLASDMRAEIQTYIGRYNLGDILSDALMIVQTDSEKVKKGLFSSAEHNHVAAILTPRWLVWAVSGTKSKAALLSAQLRDIVIEDYARTPFAKMIPDSGIQVSGRFTDVSENASAFIGLENNEAGNKFKELVIRTVQQSRT